MLPSRATADELLFMLLPSASALRYARWALHEWLGRAWYRGDRLTGRAKAIKRPAGGGVAPAWYVPPEARFVSGTGARRALSQPRPTGGGWLSDSAFGTWKLCDGT